MGDCQANFIQDDMNRSKWFLMANTLGFVAVLILFYYSRTAQAVQQASSVSAVSQKDFVKESALLDSLFKNYKIASAGNDKAALVESKLRLKNHLSKMSENCDQKSLSHNISCKLINNYGLRIQLIVAVGQARNESSNKTHILKTHIAELEKSNEQIRIQNQMVEQAILNLP